MMFSWSQSGLSGGSSTSFVSCGLIHWGTAAARTRTALAFTFAMLAARGTRSGYIGATFGS